MDLSRGSGPESGGGGILLMEEIRLTTWDVSNLVNDGINYLSTA